MSERITKGLTNLSLIVGILIGVFGAIQSYSVLPYRVEQTEMEVRALKEQGKNDREILIRIEEQLKALREEVRNKQ